MAKVIVMRKPGRRRPEGGEKRKRKLPDGYSLIWLTVSEEDKAKIRVAAAKAGVPMSEYARQVVIHHAGKDSR